MAKAALEQKALVVVPEYMVAQNRPYSAIDVYTNLRQEFGKTLVIKALECGVTSGVLKEKVIGKQKIYYADQDKFEKFDDSALKEYDEKIAAIAAEIDKASAEWRDIQSALKDASGTETTPQLERTLAELTEKVASMENRVSQLEAARGTDTEGEGKKAKQVEAAALSVLKKRKRMACDIINAIREGCPLSKKQLIDSIGLEVEDGEL